MDFFAKSYRVTVNVATWDALRREIARRLEAREGFALATLNLDHLVKLRGSAHFREAYAATDLVVADGNPIVWMSRLAGKPVELIPGSDAILPIARIAAEKGADVALVGSTDATLAEAKRYLEAEVPGLSVVVTNAPPMGFDPAGPGAEAIFDRLKAAGADLCFVALGAPRQEIFAAHGRSAAPSIGFVSIGAGLDFFAGQQTRAPRWVRRLAMEWLWRALSNPTRLGPRYLRCLGLLPLLAVNALRQRTS